MIKKLEVLVTEITERTHGMEQHWRQPVRVNGAHWAYTLHGPRMCEGGSEIAQSRSLRFFHMPQITILYLEKLRALKHMNTSPKVLGFVLICVFPGLAMAESDFQAGGAVGIQSKQVEFSYANMNLKPTFQMIAYTLTASYGQFFANVELEAMIEGDSQYFRNTSTNTTTTFDFKRSDSTITLGYNLWRGLSVFGGYKQGETEASISSVAFDTQQLVISEKGPFAGIAYGQPIGKKGTLAVSAAYASFDAESIVRYVGSGTEFKSGGTTSGLSYGVSWTGSLSESSYYRLSYKINEYRFKDKDQVFADTSTDEDYRIFGLSLGTSF